MLKIRDMSPKRAIKIINIQKITLNSSFNNIDQGRTQDIRLAGSEYKGKKKLQIGIHIVLKKL